MEVESTAWLFNSDFEKKLFLKKLDHFETSKSNQEFEFFIHLLEPNKVIYSSKTYSSDYKEFLKLITGKELKHTLNARYIRNWCQDDRDYETLQRLQSKYETARFAISKKLWKHEARFIKDECHLREGYLYKMPDGLSGMGHLHFPLNKKKILNTIKKYGEILEEEILERSRDFSTLVENGSVVAIYENYIDDYYQYKGTCFSSQAFFSDSQIEEHHKNLELILSYSNDYKGIMSIDGFLHKKGINSVCEINVRKTMGHVSYKLWMKYFPGRSDFKLLLIKNESFKWSHSEVMNKFDGQALLISPLTNRFLVFIFGANSKDGLIKVERDLCTDFF